MPFIIGVGTKSALKIRAIESALHQLEKHGTSKLGDLILSPWELRTGNINSGVPAQPFGFEQMFEGAINRARKAQEAYGAEIGIGIENGLVDISGDRGRFWIDPPAVAIVYPRWQITGLSLGAALPIPRSMVREVQEQQTELGVIIQKRAGGGEKDPHKFLSRGILDRESIIAQAILIAFATIVNADEYRTLNPNE
jgi:non-canonical (house-cleaning) NTP pyrophosphatase